MNKAKGMMLTEASNRNNKSFLFLSNPVNLTLKYRPSPLLFPFPAPSLSSCSSILRLPDEEEGSTNACPGAPNILGSRKFDDEGVGSGERVYELD